MNNNPTAEQEGGEQTKRRRKKKKSAVLIFVRDIAVMSIIAFLLVYFFKPIVVKQTSMLPTLQQDNYLFLSKQAYNFGKPERGDIIVFPFYKKDKMDYYIKRVIGLPGDRIDIKEGKVYINGEPEDDHYTKDRTTPGDITNLVIPKGELFVLGDNRLVSVDSRDPAVGTIKIDSVIGQAIFRLLPLSEAGPMK